MAAPSYARSLGSSFKRLRLSPSSPINQHRIRTFSQLTKSTAQVTQTTNQPVNDVESELSKIRLPKAVQATYLNPLRRQSTLDITSCDLQLRSYSVRNLEVFSDFAMRAAYFLKLPAKGPIPLKRITERYTVPRSNFIHKKSQENFERITLRRWIRIVDGHPETVSIWLAFLRKHAYYGVGMKANVYENSGLDVAEDLDKEQEAIRTKLGEKLNLIGGMHAVVSDAKKAEKMLLDEPFKATWASNTALGGTPSVPHANKRIATVKVR